MSLGQGWDAVCVTCGEPHGLFGCEQLDAEMRRRLKGYGCLSDGVGREWSAVCLLLFLLRENV